MGYAQSKEEKGLQDRGLSYPNLQAYSCELLLVLQAEFSFFLNHSGFGLCSVSEDDSSVLVRTSEGGFHLINAGLFP